MGRAGEARRAPPARSPASWSSRAWCGAIRPSSINAALIITGKWPQTRNKGEQAYMLCLFDKQTAKVEIQEIEAPLFK